MNDFLDEKGREKAFKKMADAINSRAPKEKKKRKSYFKAMREWLYRV